MAGDWIKMRVDLCDDPSVIKISSETNLDEDTVVGKLHRLWCWADRHTIDGQTDGVTIGWIDRYVNHKGFAEAMVNAKWLMVDGDHLTFPHFERHNGKTAKKRAENTLQQRLSCEMRDNGATGVARDVIPRPFRRRILCRDGYKCVYCGRESSAAAESHKRYSILSIDHLIPISRGGKTVVENLVTCCLDCNMEKADRTCEEWGLYPEFLQNGLSFDVKKGVTQVSRKKRDASSLLFSKTVRDLIEEDVCVSINLEQAWAEWLRHRREIKKPMTEISAAKLAKKLVDWGDERAIAAIDHTIASGWQGLREPEPARNGKPATQPKRTRLREN